MEEEGIEVSHLLKTMKSRLDMDSGDPCVAGHISLVHRKPAGSADFQLAKLTVPSSS